MRLVHRLALAVAPALLAAACAGAPASPAPSAAGGSFDPERAPLALSPLVARSSEAVDQLQRALSRRLMEELSDAPNAVLVCRDEAPALAAEVGAARGLAVGRTSHRLVNGLNAPRPWARDLMARALAAPATARAVAVDLGDRVGYLRPIAMSEACLKCHGPDEELSPGVRAALQGSFPAAQATGFALGELRGFYWAEVEK